MTITLNNHLKNLFYSRLLKQIHERDVLKECSLFIDKYRTLRFEKRQVQLKLYQSPTVKAISWGLLIRSTIPEQLADFVSDVHLLEGLPVTCDCVYTVTATDVTFSLINTVRMLRSYTNDGRVLHRMIQSDTTPLLPQ